jgi:hypothetical protein
MVVGASGEIKCEPSLLEIKTCTRNMYPVNLFYDRFSYVSIQGHALLKNSKTGNVNTFQYTISNLVSLICVIILYSNLGQYLPTSLPFMLLY